MKTVTINRNTTNIIALDETLRSTLNSDYLGLSVHSGEVRVHLLDSTPSEQVHQTEQIVIDHDPSLLTVDQQADLQQQQALQQARVDNSTALDLSTYDGATTEVLALAQKIAWLELEIRELRGL